MLSTKLLQVPHCCYPHPHCTNLDTTYFCINLDIIFYTLALAFFRKKVLLILQSWGQATYWMASLQEKTTYKSALFPSGGSRARNALQKKVTRGAISEVVEEMASWIRPDLTIRTSTSAFTKSFLYSGGLPFLFSRGLSFLYDRNGKGLDLTLDDLADLR